MPLLPKEPDLHPDDLFQLPPELEWRVAHVRSRQEKMLARYLLDRGIPYFLPQIERVAESGGRRRSSYLPLFSGYLFFRAAQDKHEVVRHSNLTASILDVPDQQQLHGELEQLHKLQLAGASLIPLEEFVPGDVVRIKDGAFAGYSGIVERSARADRLIVQISLLRKTVAIEFETTMLKHPRRA